MAKGKFGIGRGLNIGAGLFVIVGIIVLLIWLAQRFGILSALRAAAPAAGVGPSLFGSAAPSGGGQFGPTTGAISASGSIAPFTATGGFNRIGAGGAVPTAPGGSITTARLPTSGPIAWDTATSPVRITSPLIVNQPGGGTGSIPKGAVISVINGVPISLSDFAVSQLGYSA